MSRAIGVIVGILFIALAVAWFATPLQDIVLGRVETHEPGTRGLDPIATWDWLKTALDAANALIGLIGIVLTVRAGKSRSSKA